MTGGTEVGDGLGIEDVNIFNPAIRQWQVSQRMAEPRWYPTNTTLFSRPKFRRMRIDNSTYAFWIGSTAYADIGKSSPDTEQGYSDVTNSSGRHVRTDTRISGYPDIDAVYNWWGTSSSSAIAAKMGANVIWNPYLTGDPYGTLSAPLVGVEAVPGIPRLLGNAPNPFRRSTVVSFHVPRDGTKVSLRIYSLTGRFVRSYEEMFGAGDQLWIWDGRDDTGRSVSSGIYYYRIQIGEFVESRKMILTR